MKIQIEIPLERISDLIITALEGGSNYWYAIGRKIEPKAWTFESNLELWAKEKIKNPKFHYIGDYPLNEGGGLIIVDLEADKTPYELNLHNIKNGLKLMAEKYGNHFGDFMSENDDAVTGDVFLQLALFEDIIYS